MRPWGRSQYFSELGHELVLVHRQTDLPILVKIGAPWQNVLMLRKGEVTNLAGRLQDQAVVSKAKPGGRNCHQPPGETLTIHSARRVVRHSGNHPDAIFFDMPQALLRCWRSRSVVSLALLICRVHHGS
jgi:hypothetical protein